jgi:Domain of unknown function (DUF6602)
MTINTKRVALQKLFLGIQQPMIAQLKADRKNITHPTAKGDTTELAWLDMIRSYIPKRYQAEKAFVLDSKGNKSDQIDIVIFDRQYSPLLLNRDGATYVPAESVYAVIEVKQGLNKKFVKYAGQKAQSVRSLYRTNAPIYHAGGIISEPKKPFTILAGIVTLDSDWAPAWGKSFKAILRELSNEQRLDFGCVLNSGAFQITYSHGDNVKVSNSRKDNSLIVFFLQLLSSLQKLGTVPAIDMEQYIKSLDDE